MRSRHWAAKAKSSASASSVSWNRGCSVALAMVRADLAEPGTVLEVEIYGERCRAVVQPDAPLWDPENERLRA